MYLSSIHICNFYVCIYFSMYLCIYVSMHLSVYPPIYLSMCSVYLALILAALGIQGESPYAYPQGSGKRFPPSNSDANPSINRC